MQNLVKSLCIFHKIICKSKTFFTCGGFFFLLHPEIFGNRFCFTNSNPALHEEACRITLAEQRSFTSPNTRANGEFWESVFWRRYWNKRGLTRKMVWQLMISIRGSEVCSKIQKPKFACHLLFSFCNLSIIFSSPCRRLRQWFVVSTQCVCDWFTSFWIKLSKKVY